MNLLRFPFSILAIVAAVFMASCEARQNPAQKAFEPQVFTPEENVNVPDSAPDQTDTVLLPGALEIPAVKEPVQPEGKPEKLPTVAELKKVTPSQEAKRALSNDAMRIYQLKPEKFEAYMQSRIPYYRGKGTLKAENDMVRIEITDKVMRIETAKGQRVFTL